MRLLYTIVCSLYYCIIYQSKNILKTIKTTNKFVRACKVSSVYMRWFYSETNEAYVMFFSDESIQYSGFRVKWERVGGEMEAKKAPPTGANNTEINAITEEPASKGNFYFAITVATIALALSILLAIALVVLVCLHRRERFAALRSNGLPTTITPDSRNPYSSGRRDNYVNKSMSNINEAPSDSHYSSSPVAF